MTPTWLASVTATVAIAGALTVSPHASRLAGPRTVWVYTEAYRCDWKGLDQADSIFERHFQPVIEQMRSEGKVLGWRYMRRSFGDEWNRILSFTVAAQDQFFPARNEAGGRIAQRDPNVWTKWLGVCGDHRENLYHTTESP